MDWSFDGIWRIETNAGNEYVGLVNVCQILGKQWIVLLERWKEMPDGGWEKVVLRDDIPQPRSLFDLDSPIFINPDSVRRMQNPVSKHELRKLKGLDVPEDVDSQEPDELPDQEHRERGFMPLNLDDPDSLPDYVKEMVGVDQK
jgi:hypothetical protein